ncbi:MAG: hypothetical protein LBS90_06140 [Oscillospiraceae bacterium]|jgi:hypothetical protein|nr:hypothetical protein [Oscillospiraceae bacterium]
MFYSILFPSPEHIALTESPPQYFADTNLDQLVFHIATVKKAHKLAPHFCTPLSDLRTIEYRQQVLRELEDGSLRELYGELSDAVCEIEAAMEKAGGDLTSFANANLDGSPRYKYFALGQFLNCASNYCATIEKLTASVAAAEFRSEGLRAFAEYLAGYAASEEFAKLRSQAAELRGKLKSVRYNMLLENTQSGMKAASARVRRYDGEESYSDSLLALFRKFRQSDGEPYKRVLPETPVSVANEHALLGLVAKTHPEVFVKLRSFCMANLSYLDETIGRFAHEIQFYIGWHEYTAAVRAAGLPLCYPTLITGAGDVRLRGMFDVVLAAKQRGTGIIPNDFELVAPERIAVITGPNQGGKTTLSRAFGQAHYLASLGLSVPGTEARLFLCDKILTHFGKQEDLEMLSGQLQDDLIRLKSLFDSATPRSIIIINEIFASTTLFDALAIGRLVMDKLTKLGAPALMITFLDELADYGENTISVAGVVDAESPERRTYRFERKRPESLAYAGHIMRKYNLTPELMDGRLQKCKS